MRRMIVLELALMICAISAVMPPSAIADSTTKRCGKTGRCYVIAKKEPRPSTPARRTGDLSPGSRADRQNAADESRVKEANKKFSAALAVYDRRLASYNRCLQTFDPSLNKTGCGSAPTPPDVPRLSSATFSGRGNQPTPTAGQAAAIAVARLQLPSIAGHQPVEHGGGWLPTMALGRRHYQRWPDFRLSRRPIRIAGS
jgi:hypothetical protein